MFTAKEFTLVLLYVLIPVGLLSLRNTANVYFLVSFLFIYFFSILNDFKLRVYPQRKFLNIIGIIISLFIISRVSLENLFGPLSNLLIFILAIKLLEEKKERDVFQILTILLFAISISSIYNLGLSFLLYLTVFSFISINAIVFLIISKYSKKLKFDHKHILRYASASSILFLLSMLTAIPLFVILPRTPQPVFAMIQKEGTKTIKTGISSEVKIGKVGEIQQDKSVVFRVTDIDLEGTVPYWRVQVFDTYKNNKWTTEAKKRNYSNKISGKKYTIILNPTGETYIPLLDYPTGIASVEGTKAKFLSYRGGIFKFEKPVNSPVKIEAYFSENIEGGIEWDEYIKLTEIPENINPYILKVAEDIKERSKDEMEVVEKVKEFFKDFEYTMKLTNHEGDPLEYFLKVSKRGNCEYFATATALILRATGIPARVVGGFKGAIKNPNANYYLIKNSMAHVWVEAFINGRWIRIDTTPPYIPPGVRDMSKWELLKDSIIFFWYSNVVNFSSEHQKSIIGSVKNLDEFIKYLYYNLKNILSPYIIPIVLLIISSILFAIHQKRRKSVYIYQKLIDRLSNRLNMDMKGKSIREILDHTKNLPIYGDVKYIINIYLKDRFSQNKAKKEEIKEAKKRLKNI